MGKLSSETPVERLALSGGRRGVTPESCPLYQGAPNRSGDNSGWLLRAVRNLFTEL